MLLALLGLAASAGAGTLLRARLEVRRPGSRWHRALTEGADTSARPVWGWLGVSRDDDHDFGAGVARRFGGAEPARAGGQAPRRRRRAA